MDTGIFIEGQVAKSVNAATAINSNPLSPVQTRGKSVTFFNIWLTYHANSTKLKAKITDQNKNSQTVILNESVALVSNVQKSFSVALPIGWTLDFLHDNGSAVSCDYYIMESAEPLGDGPITSVTATVQGIVISPTVNQGNAGSQEWLTRDDQARVNLSSANSKLAQIQTQISGANAKLAAIQTQVSGINTKATSASSYFLLSASTIKYAIVSGAHTLVRIEAFNKTANDIWLQLFDASNISTINLGTTTPKLSLQIPKGDGTNYGAYADFQKIKFSTGIAYAVTTTPTGNGTPSTGAVINATYN